MRDTDWRGIREEAKCFDDAAFRRGTEFRVIVYLAGMEDGIGSQL
ncbi:MAG: hypothetical protein ACLU3U_04770 [Gallintestinimicrobium sp.]